MRMWWREYMGKKWKGWSGDVLFLTYLFAQKKKHGLCNNLNGGKSTSCCCLPQKVPRMFPVNCQCLAQAALVRWFDGCIVLDQRKERTLRPCRMHPVDHSFPEPRWKTLHYPMNVNRKQVLAILEECRVIFPEIEAFSTSSLKIYVSLGSLPSPGCEWTFDSSQRPLLQQDIALSGIP